jgi:CHAD domain-containing protein
VQARAAKVLRGKRYRRLLTALATAAASPVPKAGRSATAEADLVAKIAKPHRKLADAVAAMGVDPADQELHDLRILGKKLRYAAEIAAPVGGRPVRDLVKATKRLQDVLGEHQDACVAETRLRALTPADVDQAFVAGRLVERERGRQAEMRATWHETFVEVDAAATALTA